MRVKPLSVSLAALIAGASLSSQAAELELTLTNLTAGNHFTPVLVAAHPDDQNFFQAGEPASAPMQAIAEGGDISALQGALEGLGAPLVANPAEGLLAPGASTSFMLDTGDQPVLSLAAMILPTNDAFIGIDSWTIPSEPGTYMVYISAWDAGTEANDEIINGGGASGVPGIPVAPAGDGGTNGTGVTDASPNTMVHIHPGVIGDTDPAGGMSDLDARVHRWLNPVARLMVTVK
ncbi:spondin domain-containing protein [Paraferrimonas sedimenticola]|uniref:Spondin domain-containing protein n=1 Tax=Paraferrimonas sedimenticola TaxID=375674 RepID=A0AA37RX06_9GAMM|nr:spondin domain-containing protein [Paraferrimonas sedimenticola]GLP96187.1 hypothetical protein GCM10007895_14930 [Paraferrimonas sedimenticola]